MTSRLKSGPTGIVLTSPIEPLVSESLRTREHSCGKNCPRDHVHDWDKVAPEEEGEGRSKGKTGPGNAKN